MYITFIAELGRKLAPSKRTQLNIAARNPAPVRESQYPSTWELYCPGGRMVVITISRDDHSRPHIACKRQLEATPVQVAGQARWMLELA
jgi:hypothetical protein